MWVDAPAHIVAATSTSWIATGTGCVLGVTPSDKCEATMAGASTADDPHDLNRFVRAQVSDYQRALAELQSGRKRSHWIWYIFPQIDGLGFSSTAKRYAIKSLDEAKAYLAHPILGPRLTQCAEAMLSIENRTANEILGAPDDLKLRSCATLFACVAPKGSVFDRLLEKFYRGERDDKTLRILGGDLSGRA
jgi:uncharacterized protein (DUF1810 family)